MPVLLDFNKVFQEVCAGNRDALAFCHVFLHWVHFIDDVIDNDAPPRTQESIVRLQLEAALTFAFNPFFQANKASLSPLVLQGVKAYADSIAWALRPDGRDRKAAEVLKSQYQEVFWHVAFLCGGYEHMDRITKAYRTYDYDSAE